MKLQKSLLLLPFLTFCLTVNSQTKKTYSNVGNTKSNTGVKVSYSHAVDLGLSVMWADMNVGASTPEGYGNFYAWGETKEKNEFSTTNYKWGSSSSYKKYCTNSKYGNVDNFTKLSSVDDAANVNWGGKWRMPTDKEAEELCTKCTWTKTTQKGINVYKVTGPNGNSIFLPMGGYYEDPELSSAGNDLFSAIFDLDLGDGKAETHRSKGEGGYFWTSVLNSDINFKAVSFWGSGNKHETSLLKHERYRGLSVRAVCPK